MADAAVSKTVGLITRVGSTPTPGIAHVAQSVEHILGKNEVISSILIMGLVNEKRRALRSPFSFEIFF